ncbi:hypothetical protein SANT12839_007160 [Streptomyces antimycoticus]|uniref:Nitroreductase family deazaflavin-dependent oxidoreductase n=1 Tax=Streptomyces antimycoticus TaxID=68175 RepID=A0A4D4JVD2_9ACTN|nr:hypothetical protein SANT12839_007160 [Streptomyces antimycoticus]
MPLQGEYEPSPEKFVRDQVELFESSGGTEGTTMRGMPVVLLTTRGAKSGKIRKTPLMRVEHNGTYAVVASLGGSPNIRSGTSTSWATRGSSCRTARCGRT